MAVVPFAPEMPGTTSALRALGAVWNRLWPLPRRPGHRGIDEPAVEAPRFGVADLPFPVIADEHSGGLRRTSLRSR